MLHFQNLHGSALEPHLDALGALRIAVFREYPYLYDGSLEYERDYLRAYLHSQRSLVVLVFDDDALVGATTCLPLTDEGAEFQAAFAQAGHDLATIGYFGESFLLPRYRGQGVGKEFFRRREAHARCLGLQLCAFCAVDRAAEHPLRPVDYRPLDDFWRAQGYTRQPGLQAVFTWKEITETVPSPKTLTFWTKRLDAAPSAV